MKTKHVLAAALLVAAFVSPKANAANVILNGGFEGGVHTSGANTGVPNNWVSNAAFDNEAAFNHVQSSIVNTPTFALQIGNFDGDPLAQLSQTFNDLAGATYTVMFFYDYRPTDGNAFLTISAGGQSFTTAGVFTNGFVSSSFTFTGSNTGSDTITISARTNPDDWYVDDVSVNGPAAVGPGVPEPSTWAMMLLGFAGLGFAFHRSRPKVSFA
jgi:PEP-CTERM motif